jgi:hypothetical protein
VRRAILSIDEAESLGGRPSLVARGVAALPGLLGVTVASR